MKIYQEIKDNNSKKIKILGICIYSRITTKEGYKKKYLGSIYKIKKINNSKKYYLCGIQFRVKKQKVKNLIPAYNITNAFIMEYFCERQQTKYQNNPLNIDKLINNSKSVMLSCSEKYLNHAHGWTKYLFKGNLYPIDSLPYDNKDADLYVLLGGTGQTPAQIKVVVESIQCNKPVLILESAFLRSVNTFCEEGQDEKYRYDVGFVLDYLAAYYDATKESYLEKMLNDKNLVLTQEQITRARNCINKITSTHLTKYNCQPIFTPEIGRKGAKKVLVVDQSFGDNSIKKGLASISTFEKMLNAAIEENPDADIIIKTHPDTKTGARTGYYSNIKPKDSIFLYTDAINPISLINYVDKVYVCTTQLGFEALMCNKETHIFGMPFYAGWGIGNSRQKCERRTNTRTLEEIFYIAYIMYSYYINPETKQLCEIEEAMDYLLDLRDEYFKLNNLKYELENKDREYAFC